MDLREFGQLTHEERFKVTQERLFQLKKEGKGTKEFKNETVDFSYTTAMNKLDNKYKLNYEDYCLMEKSSLKKVEMDSSVNIDNINLKNLVSRIVEDKLLELKQEETQVNALSKNYTENVIVQKRKSKELKKMTITISDDVYKRWKEFSDGLGIYNNIDLLNTAITSYLDSVNFKNNID